MRNIMGAMAFSVWAVIAAYLMSPPAHADTTDDAYVATLQAAGVPVPNWSSAVELGHSICGAAAKGYTDREIANIMMANGFEHLQAFYVIGAAEAAYCPIYASRSTTHRGI